MIKANSLTKYGSFFLVFFLLFYSTTIAQIKTDEENITSKFFQTFTADPMKAYEELFKSNEFIPKSDIESTKIKFKDYISDLGDYLGNEAITVKRIGKSYIS